MMTSVARVLAAVAVAFAVTGTALAFGRPWMDEAQIRAELTNVQLAGIYPSKVEWREFIHADGRSDYEERGEKRPGRWTVAGELFCFVYVQPEQGGCFRMVKHSANCYELFTASLGGEKPAVAPPAASMSWNGRMWREAQPSTCDEKPIS